MNLIYVTKLNFNVSVISVYKIGGTHAQAERTSGSCMLL